MLLRVYSTDEVVVLQLEGEELPDGVVPLHPPQELESCALLYEREIDSEPIPIVGDVVCLPDNLDRQLLVISRVYYYTEETAGVSLFVTDLSE